jgi:two-component system response regulator RegX3
MSVYFLPVRFDLFQVVEGEETMQARVLIIEDEREIGELIAVYLQKEGIDTEHVDTGEQGLEAVRSRDFDLVVLDINLPGIDGYQFLQVLRRELDLPVIIVSARNADEDLILGLGIGADEFVTKPFSLKVLAARVRALLRRSLQVKSTSRKTYRFGTFTLDRQGRILEKHGRRVPLPPREFELLELLACNPGTTMSPERIYERVWGQRYGDLATVAIHVQRLRRKIEEDPAHPRFIQTIKGFGYRFNPGEMEEQ